MTAVSPDIQRAIEIIDQRIQSLQRIREMLVAEFGIENGSVSKPAVHIASISSGSTNKTRKQLLVEFLKARPSVRKEIQEITGLPRGTISFLLNDKETFQRLADGRWTVR
jgi:hypothetical protein